MPSPIQILSMKYPGKIYITDALLEERFGGPDTWEYLTEGGEKEVYTTRNGEFVIKKSLSLSDEEYDYDSEDEDEIEDESIKKFKRFQLELSLISSDQLTTTLFVSPLYSVEKKKHNDLMEYIENNPETPSMKDRLLLCLDIYKGLNLIHFENMAHLDIKPENIFVYNRSLSIGDFGTLSRCHGKSESAKGDVTGWGPTPSTHIISTKICKQVDLYSMALVTVGILAWDSDIITHCSGFKNAVKGTSSHLGLCNVLRGVFESIFPYGSTNYINRCFFPNTIDSDLVERLKRGLTGHECGSIRTTASKMVKILQEMINRL